MRETSLKISGFISAEKEDLQVRGGVSWDLVAKFVQTIATVATLVKTYQQDFIKGYKNGLAGKKFSLI